MICQQVRFLFHGERKKVIFLSFTAANWVVASASNEGTLSGIFVGLATLIDLQDLMPQAAMLASHDLLVHFFNYRSS